MILNNMVNEVWKDIPEYEGLYQVSNLGRIKSVERKVDKYHHVKERILKPSLSKGYYKLNLSKDFKNKTIYVHKLVAKTFIDNIKNYPCVNHKNENKLDNSVDNLEWCTHLYNVHYGTAIKRMSEKQKNSKLSSKPVKSYNKDGEVVECYPSIMEAHRKTNIKPANIIQCCKGQRKTAGGYVWRYDYEI